MGTQLGNVTKIYGQKHNATVTNLNGETIMNSKTLNKNTFIVSAPQTINKEDIGTYSLFITDSEGQPVRLSYTLQPGNGLVIGRNGQPEDTGDGLDIISMAIDNYSIKADDSEYPEAIYVKKENIIDNDTLMVVTPQGEKSCIKVITEHLDHAGNTPSGFGIAKGDDTTIMTHDGILYVNTRNLDYADDESDTHGIIDANTNPYRTIRADQGILSVWTQNLDRATEDSVGVVKPDGTYTFTNNDGTLTVSNFVYTYSYWGERTVTINGVETTEEYRWDEHGIVIPDLVTLGTGVDENGKPTGEMHVITDGLDRASETQYGVVKPDGVSTGITTDGLLEVKQYARLQAIMDEFDERYTLILDKLAELEGRIVILETTSSAENIELDIDNSMLTILSKPTWDEESKSVVSPMENVSVELRVSTNCKFKVSVEYENNINPAIVLTQLKLGSNIVVTAAGLQDYEFDSTNDTINQLKLTFECSNYSSNTNESEISTVATIKITSMNDASVYKKAVHTFVRHNTTKYVQKETHDKKRPPTTQTLIHLKNEPAYVTNMTVYDNNYSSSIPRSTTSSELVKFNIQGPYYKYNILNPDEKIWTNSKEILPTFSKPETGGYLGIKIDYFTRSSRTSTELIPDTDPNPNTRNWLKHKLETTYKVCNGVDPETGNEYSYNMVRLYSAVPLAYTKPYRTAKVTFSYYNTYPYVETDRPITTSYEVIYNENLEDTRPTLDVVLTLSNSSPYIKIEATKNHYALMQNNDWSLVTYLKYINAAGNFINPDSVSDFDYELTGSVTTDTLVYEVNTKPELPSNDIVGCKIVKVKTDSFQYNKTGEEGPTININNRNVWVRSRNTSKITFGNATIAKMRVNKWDDLELNIEFDIVPGTTTYIPNGASINELFSTADGQRAFKFFRGSSSYDWTKYYDVCLFSATKWDTFGTTVTFSFKNNVSTSVRTNADTNATRTTIRTDNADSTSTGGTSVRITTDNTSGTTDRTNSASSISTGTSTRSTSTGASTRSNAPVRNSMQVSSHVELNTISNRFEVISSQLEHLYDEDVVQLAASNITRALPALDSFGYIRFWFALSATHNRNTSTTNFEVSTTGLSDKIGTGNQCFRYNVSIEMPLSIINGYYKTAISTSNISQVGNLINVSEFAQTVAELKDSINELKTVESAAVLVGTFGKPTSNMTNNSVNSANTTNNSVNSANTTNNSGNSGGTQTITVNSKPTLLFDKNV